MEVIYAYRIEPSAEWAHDEKGTPIEVYTKIGFKGAKKEPTAEQYKATHEKMAIRKIVLKLKTQNPNLEKNGIGDFA